MLLVTVSGAGCLDAFTRFLRDVHVMATVVGDDALELSIAGAVSELHERREILGYVATFNALNPGCTAEAATG